MTKEHYILLQQSESVVASMAATIFAAYIQANAVNQSNEDDYVKKSVEIAARLASHTDKIVKSDEEFVPQPGNSSAVL